MLIKITRGYFGYNSPDGFVVKSTRDKPFSVSKELADYLEEKEVAEVIENDVATDETDKEAVEETVDMSVDENDAMDENDDELCLDDMTIAELRKFAEDNGISIPARASKSAIIEVILSAEMPEIGAEDIV